MHWCVSSSVRVSMCSVHDVPNNPAIRVGFALLGESTSVSRKMFRFLSRRHGDSAPSKAVL